MDFISVDFERKIGKRQRSREKEKNLQRKRNISEKREFFQERFFLRENSLFHFLSTSNAFSTFLNYSHSSNTSNVFIFMFDDWKREFSLEKISPEKILFFLRFFSFSLSLCKFTFKMSLMKPSLYVGRFLMNEFAQLLKVQIHTYLLSNYQSSN